MLRRYLYHVKNRTGVCEITILATYEQAQTTSLTAASVSDPGTEQLRELRVFLLKFRRVVITVITRGER